MQELRDLGSGRAGARSHEDRVLAGDGAGDVGKPRGVDRVRERRRIAGEAS